MMFPKRVLEEKFRRFVEDDIGHGDVTTFLTIPSGTFAQAEVIAKEKGVIAGIEEAQNFVECFGLQAKALVKDGSRISKRTKILRIEGEAATVLMVERTLMNLLSRMSGIATATNRIVERVDKAGCRVKVASTRKTALGLSYFDKKAVMLGGGDTHRFGLDDMVLVKDNHIAVTGSIQEAIKRVRKKVSFSKKIEVEVQRVTDVEEAAKAGVDIIMLDNFTPKQVKEAINLLKKSRLRDKVLVEASGGINEQNILAYAKAGIDIVSLGELTDSVKALDISLEITRVKEPSGKV